MFQRILVPVDGSGTSKAGLRQAISIARGSGAQLRLLTIVDLRFVTRAPDGFPIPETVFDGVREEGRKVLDEAQQAARGAGLAAEARLAETVGERVSEGILEEARRWAADLIVIGTHGRSGLRRAVLGSDAEEVVRGASVPVLLVREAGGS